MCGRYNLRTRASQIIEYFETLPFPEWEPRYNIAPTQVAPIIRQTDAGRTATLARWGLIPFWAKESSIGNRLINARAETAATTNAFKAAFKKRRCLVPVTGFYEWQKTTGTTKQPFHIHRPDDGLFAFAGLWDRWKQPDGVELESFTILTTSANQLVQSIHDRMPVIIPPGGYQHWLDPKLENSPELQCLLTPYSGDDLTTTPVSTVVNNPRNEKPQCVEAASILQPAELPDQ